MIILLLWNLIRIKRLRGLIGLEDYTAGQDQFFILTLQVEILPFASVTITVTLLSFAKAVNKPVLLFILPELSSPSITEKLYGGVPLEAENVNSSPTYSVIATDGLIVNNSVQ